MNKITKSSSPSNMQLVEGAIEKIKIMVTDEQRQKIAEWFESKPSLPHEHIDLWQPIYSEYRFWRCLPDYEEGDECKWESEGFDRQWVREKADSILEERELNILFIGRLAQVIYESDAVEATPNHTWRVYHATPQEIEQALSLLIDEHPNH